MELDEYIKITGMTSTEFAEIVGYDRSYISRLIHKRKRAGKGVAIAIEKATNRWVTMEEVLNIEIIPTKKLRNDKEEN